MPDLSGNRYLRRRLGRIQRRLPDVAQTVQLDTFENAVPFCSLISFCSEMIAECEKCRLKCMIVTILTLIRHFKLIILIETFIIYFLWNFILRLCYEATTNAISVAGLKSEWAVITVCQTFWSPRNLPCITTSHTAIFANSHTVTWFDKNEKIINTAARHTAQVRLSVSN